MNPRVFFDFTADGEPIGRVIFELFADSVPKTAENFRALCTGEKGISPKTQLPLYYKNSIIHRSIQDFMIQGGDFTKRSGMGGESIYGAPFEDEDLIREVDSEGLLVMANRGPNTNGSQFFITLRPCPHLNGKHVVFGKVVRGYDDVAKIAAVLTDEKDRPLRPVVIINCGELERRKAPAKREPSPLAVLEFGDEDRGRGHKRKQAPSSRSASGSGPYSRSHSRSDSEGERKRKRKHKHKSKRKSKSKREGREGSGQPTEPRKETEEEYDARLEREEKEHLEAERQAEISRLREKLRRQEGGRKDQDNGGINYKGRGRMKYVDPETVHRRYDRSLYHS